MGTEELDQKMKKSINSVPAPLEHLALVILSLLPLIFPIPTNANIIITASLTVWCGCWRSVKPEPPAESMTQKDAMKFPLMGSLILFSLFLAFKFLPKDMVNLVLSTYFVLLGTFALVATADPLLAPLLPPSFADKSLHLRIPAVPFVLPEGAELSCTPVEALLCLPAVVFCAWYWNTKHYLANNALGLAFSLQGIEHLSLGVVSNGVILLCGLFFYDIFWVFCTPVMVSVAKSFDAPIKLLFPKVPMVLLDTAQQYSMLGLGDIVIPGIFVAIILRYDVLHSTAKKPRFFYSAFASYTAAVVTTIAVMNIFQAAQPALLYIVPMVLAATFGHAAAVGEARRLFDWSEAPLVVVEGGGGGGGGDVVAEIAKAADQAYEAVATAPVAVAVVSAEEKKIA